MDDKKLERIEQKLDKIDDHLANVDLTLAKQSIILDNHVKRTDELQNMVMPIKTHVDNLKFVVRLIKIGASLAAILETLRMIWH